MEDLTKTGPKDVFMHLLTIITLYVSVITFGMIIFQYINIYFPDLLHPESIRFARNFIRWPLSILVIVFPFYVWLSAFAQKDLAVNPEKRELKTRKWTIYFTVFATILVIAGDIISLIFRFLNGELTTRFILKIIVVLLIALAVFLYYGWNLKKNIPASKNPKMKLFVWTVIILGGAAIIAGFFIAGSPRAERLRRFDDQRINDLQTIQSQIISYWQVKEKLPQSLDKIKNDINGFAVPTDLETQEPYIYKINGDKSFELCATFSTSNKEEFGSINGEPMPTKPFGITENWIHNSGYTCFERIIDPDFFSPFRKQIID
ncbi:MAG: hypothetical protein US76_03790 [Parcubacteria group bacterium GW2011_GWA2_38_13b]|nr:MAG: hypothetical protein US76_03790 [Parcubacteria group bacterium GW2011_GWA2_38_13b]